MEITKILNEKIDQLLEEYKRLELENLSLKLQLESLEKDNTQLSDNNKEIIEKIDSALMLVQDKENIE